MTKDELIAAAQEAAGGLDRMRAVRSYRARIRRTYYPEGRVAEVTVWRAAGGRVRVEERGGGARHVEATWGPDASSEEVRERLLRDARISPRNVLAHADEHRLALRGHPAPDGAYVLSLADELVLYFIHPVEFRCVRMIDLARKRRIAFSGFRRVDGIVSPFVEQHTFDGSSEYFEDAYQSVAYNVEVPESVFG
jgi:hypothetical protein